MNGCWWGSSNFCATPKHSKLVSTMGCFGPLKLQWKEICQKYTSSSDKTVNKFVFSRLLNEVCQDTWPQTSSLVGSSYPLDRIVVISKIKEPSIEKTCKLAFITICSPMMSSTQAKTHTIPSFTETEMKGFKDRLVKVDPQAHQRYQQWLKMYHPEEEMERPAPTASATKRVLIPMPTLNSSFHNYHYVQFL